MATLVDGVEFCKEANKLISKTGGHIGLTGGCLYNEGDRKDIDVIIYRKDNSENEVLQHELFKIWQEMGCLPIRFFGRVTKMKWKGHHVDVIQPEYEGSYIEPND